MQRIYTIYIAKNLHCGELTQSTLQRIYKIYIAKNLHCGELTQSTLQRIYTANNLHAWDN